MFEPCCLKKILCYCEIVYMYFVKYFAKYKIRNVFFVFCISNTFVEKHFTKYLKYFLQLYFVFILYLNTFEVYSTQRCIYLNTDYHILPQEKTTLCLVVINSM